MTSLAEAYEENIGEVGNVKLLYLGVGLFAAGALLVVLAILFATTGLRGLFGLGELGAREVAGVLAGLGVPAVFVGIFSVLPASQRVRAAAAIGAGVSVLGVALFTYAYPRHWAGYNRQLTLPVVTVYFLGAFVTFACLFVAVVNFKTRNDPGGTVTLELTREGEVETVEVDRDDLADADDLADLDAVETTDGGTDAPKTGLGGVAFVGDTPDGETPTQTNEQAGSRRSSATGRPERESGASGSRSPVGSSSASRSAGGPGSGGRTGARGASPTSDGGTASSDIRSPLDDAGPGGTNDPASTTDAGDGRATDAYCGNCRHFRYVRTSDGMVPYCGYDDRGMDDMDACEEWTPNS